LREEDRLRVFEKRVLEKVFEWKRYEMPGGGEDYITRNSVRCTSHQVLLG
jgi:hypothetical protein